MPTTARISVFISYASQDRQAARLLGQAMSAAGLEVWYDETDLGGGDAWDKKIRRQIRECSYFAPVISSTTERRSEGYFRREWRLAAERTLDMADDVLFIVPIVIDDTGEEGARVPDKFCAVQWTRVPGGQPNAALDMLLQHLLGNATAGGPSAPGADGRTRSSPLASPAPPHQASGRFASTKPPAKGHESFPPPMPPFPAAPSADDRNYPRFVAEVLWWILTAIWVIARRLPRVVRVALIFWVVLAALNQCSQYDPPEPPRHREPEPEVQPTPPATPAAPASQGADTASGTGPVPAVTGAP